MDMVPWQISLGKRLARYACIVLYVGILALVCVTFFSMRGGFAEVTRSGTPTDIVQRIFPFFGLLAFTLVWTQIMVGSLMPLLTRLFPSIPRYQRFEGIFALLFALTHPTLLLIGFGWSTFWHWGFISPDLYWLVILGYAGLLSTLLTVTSALLARRSWFAQHWRTIHYLNYVTFAVVWVHSWRLGADVHDAPLRWLWLGFAVTAAGAFTWRRVHQALARRAARMVPPVQLQS